jgi:capsular polysaccharide biosynthesis protein
MVNGFEVRTSGPSGGTPDAVPFGRYGAFLRRNGRVVALALVLGIAVGGLRLGFSQRTYTSTVAIFAPPVALHSGAPVLGSVPTAEDPRPPRESTMDTEAQIALSDATLRRLATVRGFRLDRERLKKRISIIVPAYTRVLSIKVRAHTAKDARNGARTLAKSYLGLRKQIVAGIQARNRETLQRNLSLLRAQVRVIDGKPTDIARLTARGRRQVINKQIATIQRQLAQNDDKSLQSGEVVDSANLPLGPDSRRADVTLSSWLGIGLLTGLLLGLVQDRRPRRIRSSADVRRTVTVPVLAEDRNGTDGLREACRRLRNVIQEEKATTVLLSGAAGAATEAMARTLVSVCAQGGMSTTLLLVGIEEAARDDSLDDVESGPEHEWRTRASGRTSVTTIPAGGDRHLSAAVRKAGRDADLVVVTGPSLHTPETATLTAVCDLTFVVVELGGLSAGQLIAGATYLAYAAAPPRGLVLTDRAKQGHRK